MGKEKVYYQIDTEDFYQLKEELKAAQSPTIHFIGTGKEEVERMRIQAGQKVSGHIAIALSICSKYL